MFLTFHFTRIYKLAKCNSEADVKREKQTLYPSFVPTIHILPILQGFPDCIQWSCLRMLHTLKLWDSSLTVVMFGVIYFRLLVVFRSFHEIWCFMFRIIGYIEQVLQTHSYNKMQLAFKENRILSDCIIFLLHIICFTRNFLPTCPCYIHSP